ncbi:MAG: protein NO VEIN domain-containing protein [Candidatus Ranarchaeia archaeon]
MEAYEGRKLYDVSDKQYLGFDLYTIDSTTSKRRYIEVKSSFDKKRDLGLTKNEVGFLTDSSKDDRWIYALFFDKDQLLHGKYEECFDFYKIPCNEIILSDFGDKSYFSDAVLPSRIWRKIAHRTKLVLNADLISLFELFRTQYMQIT